MISAAQDVVKAVSGKVQDVVLERHKEFETSLLRGQKTHLLVQGLSILGARHSQFDGF